MEGCTPPDVWRTKELKVPEEDPKQRRNLRSNETDHPKKPETAQEAGEREILEEEESREISYGGRRRAKRVDTQGPQVGATILLAVINGGSWNGEASVDEGTDAEEATPVGEKLLGESTKGTRGSEERKVNHDLMSAHNEPEEAGWPIEDVPRIVISRPLSNEEKAGESKSSGTPRSQDAEKTPEALVPSRGGRPPLSTGDGCPRTDRASPGA